MLACVDVDYRSDGTAVAACVVFADWTSETAHAVHLAHVPHVEPYEPGALFRRELPCILAVLERVSDPIEVVIVDAYVVLDAEGTRGLGGHLFDALTGRVAVVGVAKTRFASALSALPVSRGTSKVPLWVSALGIDPVEAAERVRSMHGTHRIPTLLKTVDRQARDG